MSEEIYVRAIEQRLALEAQRAAILARVESLQASLADAKIMLAHIDELLLSIAHIIHEVPIDNTPNQESPKRARGNPKKEVVAQEVHAYLKANRAPMSRKEIFDKLADNGFIIRGANPEMVLSTMLWRTADEFGIERLKSGGYALKSWRGMDPQMAYLLGDDELKPPSVFD